MTITWDRNLFYELSVLKNAINEYISECKYKCGRTYADCIRGIKPFISNYNIYGRIVHKKAKGCSYFYKLLCAQDKNDEWVAPCNGMEKDLVEFDPNYDFDLERFLSNGKK